MYFEDDIAIDVDDLRFFGPQIRIDALDTVQGDTVLPDLQAITRKDQFMGREVHVAACDSTFRLADMIVEIAEDDRHGSIELLFNRSIFISRHSLERKRAPIFFMVQKLSFC
jgi:hypothetical protein